MLRQVLAIIGGGIAGMVVLALIEMISWQVYPMPEGIDMTDAEAMRAYVAQVPIGAKLIVLAAWVAGAFTAGFVAMKIAPKCQGQMNALFAGGMLLIAGIINAFMVPHPLWMTVIGLLQYLPMAYLGGKVAKRP